MISAAMPSVKRRVRIYGFVNMPRAGIKVRVAASHIPLWCEWRVHKPLILR
jgi:hypothetical protein